jgi:PAS domain S-box-containing protein
MTNPPFAETAATANSAATVDLVWEQCPVGLALVDATGQVLKVNRAFAGLLGYEDQQEMVGLPLIRLHPAGKAMLMQGLHRAIIEGSDPSAWSGEETFFVNRRGRPLATYTRNVRVVQADGAVVRLITSVDLSDVARLDESLEQINRVRSYAALSSSVSNELNNLLSIILGYTALLQEGTSDAKRQQVVAEGVEGAVQRATLLIKQSLYMMRRPDPVRQKTDLARFLESKLQIVRAEIGDRPIELELSMVPELKEVPLDTMQMGDALGEIIRRLHQFDPDTTRGLRARTRWEAGSQVHARFSQSTARTYAVLEFTNPGRPRNSSRPPIPLDETGETPPKHDLGMTMVERIVEAHQGFSTYESEPGGMAVFTLWLPLGAEVEEESAANVSMPPFERSDGSGPPKVLLIDDEEGLLETMASALRDRGFEVVTALDGESAILEYRQHAGTLDLVIADLVLPGMSGWEVFSHVREADPKLPVLIMSGHLEPKLEAAVNRSGAAGFLQKPFGMAVFLRRVKSLITQPAK